MSDTIGYDIGDGVIRAAEFVKKVNNNLVRIQTRLRWNPIQNDEITDTVTWAKAQLEANNLQPKPEDLDVIARELVKEGAINVDIQPHSDPLKKRDFVVTMDIPEKWIVVNQL